MLLVICFAFSSCANPAGSDQAAEIAWQKLNTFESRTQFLTEGPDGELYAAFSRHGIHRSTDNGNTWTKILWPVSGSIAINTEGDIFVHGSHKTFRSLDNGNSWTQLTISDSTHDLSLSDFAFNSKGHIFAGAFFGGLYRSTNNGDSWIKIFDGVVYDVIINDKNHIVAGRFRSTDNGNTWTENALPRGNVTSLAFNSEYHVFAVGRQATFLEGIFRSKDNGNTWELVLSPPVGTYFNHIVINADDHVFVGNRGKIFFTDSLNVEGQGVFRSTDDGESWTHIGPDSTSITDVLFLSSKDHLFVTTRDKLYRSREPTTY